MQKAHGTNPYDCMIGYSGGKDSTALVDTFIHEYQLSLGTFLYSHGQKDITLIKKKGIFHLKINGYKYDQ